MGEGGRRAGEPSSFSSSKENPSESRTKDENENEDESCRAG